MLTIEAVVDTNTGFDITGLVATSGFGTPVLAHVAADWLVLTLPHCDWLLALGVVGCDWPQIDMLAGFCILSSLLPLLFFLRRGGAMGVLLPGELGF